MTDFPIIAKDFEYNPEQKSHYMCLQSTKLEDLSKYFFGGGKLPEPGQQIIMICTEVIKETKDTQASILINLQAVEK